MDEPKLAVVVKGFPRLSETFVARELAALEARGIAFSLHALRKPGADAALVENRVRAAPHYLPEYLHEAPARVARAVAAAMRLPGFGAARQAFLADLRSEFARARVRRFGQACVLASEMPSGVRHIYVHFAHSPASVARYAALMCGIGFSMSAHAKDIWTAPDWDLKRKLADAGFVSVCNRAGHARLASLGAGAKLKLVRHGVAQTTIAARPPLQSRDGSDLAAPVRLIAVARAVEKKGLRRLLDALALLPRSLAFRLDHFGGGDLLGELRAKARALQLEDRITWHGPRPHREVIGALDASDVFVLPAVIGSDGDRDGIPNAVMEAQARGLCVVASRVGGIDEAVVDGQTGLLSDAGDVEGLARILTRAMCDPALRTRLGSAARDHAAHDYDAEAGYDELARLLREQIA